MYLSDERLKEIEDRVKLSNKNVKFSQFEVCELLVEIRQLRVDLLKVKHTYKAIRFLTQDDPSFQFRKTCLPSQI